MAQIEPGAPCLLVRTSEQPDWNGRVVSVIGGVFDSTGPGVRVLSGLFDLVDEAVAAFRFRP